MAAAASPTYLGLPRHLTLLFLVLVYTTSVSMLALSEAQPQKKDLVVGGGRRILAGTDQKKQVKKTSTTEDKIKLTKQTTKSMKLITTNSTRYEAKPIKAAITNSSTAKAIKPKKSTKNSTATLKATLSNTQLKNLTNTSNKPSKSNTVPTRSSSLEPRNSTAAPLNKTTSTKETQLIKTGPMIKTINFDKSTKMKEKTKTSQQHQIHYKDKEEEEEDSANFIGELRDFPNKFQETIVPDLEKISTTSKAYIYKANEEIIQSFEPIVGKKYASTVASLTCCIFLLLPLLLVSLIFNRIRTFFSLQKILIFIQVYLAIYFAILSSAYFATGLDPLKFFYATSKPSYVTLQVFQTLGYVFYLLMQLLNLILVFYSKDSGVGLKFLGLAQTLVGLSVGFHYYAVVFHRAVEGKPPKTSWKTHAIYAMSFFLICLFASAEKRKKTYSQEDGNDDGKKS